jgi:two-component system, OmpR family, response regulator
LNFIKAYKAARNKEHDSGGRIVAMKILVVDDNKEITDMLSLYLESLDNYECKVVNDGKEGLQKINEENFDVIILDLAMPGFSGMDIINSLKSNNLLSKKNIIVLTASELNDDDTQTFMRDGVRAVIRKPISIDDLTSAIQQAK